MALERVSDILREAQTHRRAVPAFSCHNYESIRWVYEVAEEEKLPAIAMFYPMCSELIPFPAFASFCRDAAQGLKTPVGMLLDHGESVEQAIFAIRSGFTSIMLDGSHLPLTENIQETKTLVRFAHNMGVDVEGELGCMGDAANETDYMEEKYYTDPNQAAQFAEETGVDQMAVAIGNAHGFYVKEPHIDMERLKKIRSLTDIPIALHGGTGIPMKQVHAAIELGVCKVNIGTEYMRKCFDEMKDASATLEPEAQFYYDMDIKARGGIKEYLRAKMRALCL